MQNLDEIFNLLYQELSKYQPPLVSKNNTGRYYDLWSIKDLVIEGRKRKEVFFAGIITQKSYVGFYFMPVYVAEEIKLFFKPNLLKLLNGKSCFHIKNLTPEIMDSVQDALRIGFELYQQRGWI